MESRPFINLDVNASYGAAAGLVRSVGEKTKNALNPSSIHRAGQKARALIEAAREKILSLVGAPVDSRLVFTSGATEANNAALFSQFNSPGAKGSLIISSVEHPSILAAAEALGSRGVEIRSISPRADGSFNAQDFAASVDKTTRLVSVMLANNETGQILPVKEIAAAVKAKSPHTLVHCDAVQAVGKIEVSLSDLAVDMLSVSGHKIGGLMGCGAIILRDDEFFSASIHGGPQESRLRAGTENLPGIVAFGEAAEYLVSGGFAERSSKLKQNAEVLSKTLLTLEDASINFPNLEKLSNTISLKVLGVNANDLVVALDLEGILVSSGAACASGKPLVSHVLLSMGFSQAEARETIRISVGDHHPTEDYASAGESIVRVIRRMRSKGATPGVALEGAAV